MTKPINKEDTELSELLKEFDTEFLKFIPIKQAENISAFITKTYTTALAKGQAEERERIINILKKYPDSYYIDQALSDISCRLGGGE